MSKNAVSRRDFMAALGMVSVAGRDLLCESYPPSTTAVAHHAPYEWATASYLELTGQGTKPTAPEKVRPRIFTVPGKDYAAAVKQFRAELADHYKHRAPYPIARIFQIFPINIIDGGTSDTLIRRGNLTLSQHQVTNEGAEFDGIFGDRSLGKVSISFPQKMQAGITQATADGGLIIDFSKQPITVLFFDLDSKYKILTNQQLSSITFGSILVSYDFFALNDPNQHIRVNVDLTLAPPKAQAASASFKTVAFGGLGFFQGDPNKEWHPGFVGPFKCDCCGGYSDKQNQPRNPSAPNSSDLVLYPDCMCQAQDGSYWAYFINNPFWYDQSARSAIGKTAHFSLNQYCFTEAACQNMAQELGPGTNLLLKISSVSISTGVVYKVGINATAA